jgi:hypothetical protein
MFSLIINHKQSTVVLEKMMKGHNFIEKYRVNVSKIGN